MNYEPIDFILDNEIGVKINKKEDWKTKISEQDNGVEVRYKKLSEPIRYYTIQSLDRVINRRFDEDDFNKISAYSFQIIDSLYNITYGNLKTFYLKDPFDRNVKKFNSHLKDFGNKFVYLKKIKSLLNHNNSLVEGNPYRIYYPVDLKLYSDNVLLTPNVDYFIDDLFLGRIRFKTIRAFNFYTSNIGKDVICYLPDSNPHNLTEGDYVYIKSLSSDTTKETKVYKTSIIDSNSFTLLNANFTQLQTTYGEIELYYQERDLITYECKHFVPVRFDGTPSYSNDDAFANLQQVNFRSIILT